MKEWKPDVIYASGPPHTALVVAHRLSRRYGIPWVAELRDLWVDNHYQVSSGWREKRMERLERRVLSSAWGFVTTTDQQAEILQSKYRRPAAVVLNGFDPQDFPSAQDLSPTVAARSETNGITLVHTGSIYSGKRDPSPLFEALSLLGPLADQVRVNFYGEHLEAVSEMIRRFRVERFASVFGPIPYRDSLKIQCEADVLLLLVWNHPGERNICPGKLFEYIGSRRPILMMGYPDSAAAHILKRRNLGIVLNEPREIAAQLTAWIQQKSRGGLPDMPQDLTIEFTREIQTKKLERFLADLLKEERPR
jgi:hypothetical protein